MLTVPVPCLSYTQNCQNFQPMVCSWTLKTFTSLELSDRKQIYLASNVAINLRRIVQIAILRFVCNEVWELFLIFSSMIFSENTVGSGLITYCNCKSSPPVTPILIIQSTGNAPNWIRIRVRAVPTGNVGTRRPRGQTFV